MKKVFQIGFNKCGTSSLHHFFKSNGLRSIHWQEESEGKKPALQIYRNVADNKPILFGIDEYDAYFDMEWICDGCFYFEGYKFYRKLYEEYPNSYYILNVRNVDNWINSRKKHPDYAALHKRVYGFKTNEEMENFWRSEWQGHCKDVMAFFEGKKNANFLVFDIEKDPIGKLIDFMPEFKLDAARYEIKNKTPNPMGRFVESAKAKVRKRIKPEIRERIKAVWNKFN